MPRTRLIAGMLLPLLLGAPVALAAEVSEAIEPKEKVVLFDGKSLDGWHVCGSADTWSVKDGVLACSGKPAGYVRTLKDYKNYRFRAEYRFLKPGNSGVLVHMTGKDGVWPKSLECQGAFRNQGDFWEIGGVEFNEHKVGGHRVSGRRVTKYDPHAEKEVGEWSVYEVYCDGATVRPYVNGKLMNEATDCSVTSGKICLQSEGSQIEWRNITLEPLTARPWPVTPKEKIALFNGKDLTGWVRFIPDDKKGDDGKWTVDKVWSVQDGIIHCTGVPHGYIRTQESYANYRLHVEWRWVEKPTNSGVLLHKRGIDKVWPTCVEAQLMHENAGDFWLLSHSTIKVDGQQIGPKDYANGKKRGGHAEKPPGEWNTYDITCDGGKVTLVVNGKTMNEGADADPSSGPICLQSEGSPIQFRNVTLEPIGK